MLANMLPAGNSVLASIFSGDDPLAIVAIIAILLAIEGTILACSGIKAFAGFFKYVPSMFWIYFVPMVIVAVGLLPPAFSKESQPSGTVVYSTISTYILPTSLILLLLSVDLKGILRLGPVALTVMLAGSLGIIIGMPLAMLILGNHLPEGTWKGLGALSASWTGGSANMIAVFGINDTPQPMRSLMMVIDTICPYAWMSLLIVLSRYQGAYDRLNRSNHAMVNELAKKVQLAKQVERPLNLPALSIMLAIGAVGTWAAMQGSSAACEFDTSGFLKGSLGAKALTLLLATTIGLVLSFTPARRLEDFGASKLGYYLLYFVLAAIGAQASLEQIGQVPLLLGVGFFVIIVHAVFIIVAARLLRAPMSLMAAASQANVGGPASTPVLADIYQPGLAQVGLLLAVFGNIIGTYMGWACSKLCQFVAGG